MVVLAFLAETRSWEQPVDTNVDTRVRCGRNVPGLPECHSALVLGVLAVVEVLAAVFVAMVEVLTSVKAMVAVAVAAVAAVPVAVPVAAAVPSAKVAVTAAPTPEVVAKPPLTQALTRAA